MPETWKDGKRICGEWAMRPLHEDPRSKDADPNKRPFCCAVPPYDMSCFCDNSCKTARGDHRCKACGWTWRIVGEYREVHKRHVKCAKALDEFAKTEGWPPGSVKGWCDRCAKRSRWVAWIETVGAIPATVPLSECEACRSNDNYRFAYGCSGPCKNQARPVVKQDGEA